MRAAPRNQLDLARRGLGDARGVVALDARRVELQGHALQVALHRVLALDARRLAALERAPRLRGNRPPVRDVPTKL